MKERSDGRLLLQGVVTQVEDGEVWTGVCRRGDSGELVEAWEVGFDEKMDVRWTWHG